MWDGSLVSNQSLGERMKRYELVNRNFIQPRTPTIIRLDGKAFHTFTKRFKFPFSQLFHAAMLNTTCVLTETIQNVRVAYTQSDEISILLNDWSRLESQQWFGGNIQKMVSVSAGIATAAFNHEMVKQHGGFDDNDTLPVFDSRVFQLPKEEVVNYFVWRQQDAVRNSIQMLGQSEFSHTDLHGISNSGIQDRLIALRNINWNNLSTWKKRGTCVTSGGIVDADIPTFNTNRQYIEQHLGNAA